MSTTTKRQKKISLSGGVIWQAMPGEGPIKEVWQVKAEVRNEMIELTIGTDEHPIVRAIGPIYLYEDPER